jgi:ABC-2 type transport system permease protein
MSWRKVFAVIRREYLERVRTKAFWFATFLVPAFFLGYMAVQVTAMRKASGERRVAVVDVTGHLAQPLAGELAAREEARRQKTPGSRGIHWILEPRLVVGDLDKTKEALRKEVLDKKLYGYLVLDPTLLEKERAEYYSISVSEFVALTQMKDAINRTILHQKIADRGLPASVGEDLEKTVDLKTWKVTTKGVTEEKGAGIIAALVFMILMYLTFFIYGFQNLRGVIEEKTSRIVEVLIASVRPTELMLGKIVGIGLVGLTQYLVWSLVAMNLSLPAIAGLMAMGETGAPLIPLSMIGYFLLFFVLGYFLYASIFTAVGAPFNTDQEAQQFAIVPQMLIVSGVAVYPAVMNNPNGPVAVVASLIPFTAPLIMYLRTAIAEPPAWQIGLSIVILVLSTMGIAWIAGRIYRVGILMYGKKPTIPEILRWVRYRPGKALQPAAPPAR